LDEPRRSHTLQPIRRLLADLAGHALLGRANEARRYGRLALDTATRGKADSFTLGYAYEALARAEAVSGNRKTSSEYVTRAKEAAAHVSDEQSKPWLLDDLRSI